MKLYSKCIAQEENRSLEDSIYFIFCIAQNALPHLPDSPSFEYVGYVAHSDKFSKPLSVVDK